MIGTNDCLIELAACFISWESFSLAVHNFALQTKLVRHFAFLKFRQVSAVLFMTPITPSPNISESSITVVESPLAALPCVFVFRLAT